MYCSQLYNVLLQVDNVSEEKCQKSQFDVETS